MAELVQMVALSPTMDEGVILEWKKSVGDVIAVGDVLCEVETDKASMDYESNQKGEIIAIIKDKGNSAKVGDVIAILGSKGEDYAHLLPSPESSSSQTNASEAQADTTPATSGLNSTAPSPIGESAKTKKASPLARKLASIQGIDISSVQGSGPNGKIIKRDIEAYQPQPSRTSSVQGDTEIPVTGTRAAIARRLSESKFAAPHYYLKVSIDMTRIIAARASFNKKRQKNKVGMNAFFLKFVAEALKKHPMANASWQGDTIKIYGSIDIGTAVDRGNGLLTPIVRDCGNKGIVDIDSELSVLIEKVNEGTLRPGDYTGATFTISNLGSFGVEEFSAIINPPGVAILAIGQTKQTPVVDEKGEISIRPIMKVTLSCDHRVLDGAEAGRFIAYLKAAMEDPMQILF